MRLLVSAVVLAALSVAPATAATRSDSVIDAITASEIAAIVTESNYDVEVKTDNHGDPYLVSERNGTKFIILFNGCNKAPDPLERICGDIQFRSGYTLPSAASLERMNQWNSDFRFGKAYLDEDGDPTIEMVVSMSGGVTRAYVRNMLKWWEIVLGDFEAHIGWGDDSEPEPEAKPDRSSLSGQPL